MSISDQSVSFVFNRRFELLAYWSSDLHFDYFVEYLKKIRNQFSFVSFSCVSNWALMG